MTWLLDGRVLLALSISRHPHHERAYAWFSGFTANFATCQITQGRFLREFGKHAPGCQPEDAMRVLLKLIDFPDHTFWPEDIGYETVPLAHLPADADLTDAYLAALARRHGGKVATMDEAFAKLYPDDVELIP